MVKLYNGDCYDLIKTIPDKSVDLCILDPPYLFDENGGGGAFGTKQIDYHNEYRNLDLNNGLYGFDNSILYECVRVLKHINIYIWCNKKLILQILNFFKDYNYEILVWCKNNPVPTCNNKYLSDIEYCIFVREQGVPMYGDYNTKHKFYITNTNKQDKELYKHPTIKPIEIIRNFIINSSKENDTILDPFMGSGTTGVACKSLNRNFIGIEINKDYFETCNERIGTDDVEYKTSTIKTNKPKLF